MSSECYTVITFAPVQGFIEKSRKLRDLYGSSYILSFLSWIICQKALTLLEISVISPALPNVTQGMPNQIILKGNFQDRDRYQIKEAFYKSWGILVDSCREWIEKNVKNWKDDSENINQWNYTWQRDWELWKNHAWEFFWASGEPDETITQVRERINQVKSARDWTGINWQGESSTLSGADAIAYPNLGRIADPRNYNYQQEKTVIDRFYAQLSEQLGDSFIESTPELIVPQEEREKKNKIYGSSFIDVREQLSIPELIKRLITHKAIVAIFGKKLGKLGINFDPEQLQKTPIELNPETFKDLNRLKDDNSDEEKYWTGWFLGDGDGAAKYLKMLGTGGREVEEQGTGIFSQEMRQWGQDLKNNQKLYLQGKGRMIYAGGDDFLGVLYNENRQIPPLECFQWFYTFKSQVWDKKVPFSSKPQPKKITAIPESKKITASVGFVWAGPQVPQRDVLQHCHKAEESAKKTGRDRIAFRILFNSGNHIEWVCPWWLLDKVELEKLSPVIQPLLNADQNLIESYQDREAGNNWTHFYQDVATLKSRHAFSDKQIDIALALIEIYFGDIWQEIIGDCNNWWNSYDADELQIFTGILGDAKRFKPKYPPQLYLFVFKIDYLASILFIFDSLNNDTKVTEAFNNWTISLAQVGFYLTDDNGNTIKPSI